MPFSLLIILMLLVSSLSITTIKVQEGRMNALKTGDYNQTGRVLTGLSKNQYHWNQHGFDNAEKLRAEDVSFVNGVAIRTCRTIHTLNLLNDCPNPYDVANNWSFIGSPITQGNLLSVWDTPSSSVFTCGNEDAFGRDLMQKAIPRIFISDNNFRYDFSDMTLGDSADPCMYTDFIGR